MKLTFSKAFIKPKSVIRHAVSVFDWENEAFGHLARFCPHPVSRAIYPKSNDRFGLNPAFAYPGK